MAWVYVLWSQKLYKRYIGSTRKDPKTRLHEHNRGSNKFTKGGVPWTLLHVERYRDYSSARKREVFLKTGVGRRWLNELFPHATPLNSY